MKKRNKALISLAALLAAAAFAGCAKNIPAEPAPALQSEVFTIEDEAVALADSPAAVPASVSAKAAGSAVRENGYAKID